MQTPAQAQAMAWVKRRVNRLLSDPHFQQFAAPIVNDAIANGWIDVTGARSPGEALLKGLIREDPEYGIRFFENSVRNNEQAYGPVDPAPARARPEQQVEQSGIDWAKEIPIKDVLERWKSLPANERIRRNARSPVIEAQGRHFLAKAGTGPLPGLTPGETLAAYFVAAAHSKALKEGGREAYDALARHTGGLLGDGQALQEEIEAVSKIGAVDSYARVVGERIRKEEAQRLKGRQHPVRNPLVRPDERGMIPVEAAILYQGPPKPDKSREPFEQAYDRLAAQIPASRRNRTTVHNKQDLHLETAYRQLSGEGFRGLEASPQLRKQLVSEFRDTHLAPEEHGPSGLTSSGPSFSEGQGEAQSEASGGAP